MVRDLKQKLRGLSKVYVKRIRHYRDSRRFNYELWVFEDSWQSKYVDSEAYEAAISLKVD